MQGPDHTTGSEYADSVRGVLERAAEVEAAQAQRTKPRSATLTSGPIMGVLAVVFAGVVFYNVRFFTADPDPVTPEEAEVTSGITVMIATQAIEAYRQEHGRLPASLAELGFPEGALDYRVTGADYTLGVSMDGAEVVEFSSEAGPLGILEEMGLDVGGLSPPPEAPIR